MTWKLYLGAAGLLTATLISFAGCGGNTESSTIQSQSNTTTVSVNKDVRRPDMTTTTEGSTQAFVPEQNRVMPRINEDNMTGSGFNHNERSRMPETDYATAAATLGVAEDQLKEAFGNGPPDFSAAASALGVTEEALMNALGFQGGMQPGGGPPPNDQGAGMAPGGPQNSN